MKTKLDAYKEVLTILESITDDEDVEDIISAINDKVKLIELGEMFGIDLCKMGYRYSEWMDIGSHSTISLMGERYGRTISWSDDDRQPEDEWLYSVRWPTGAFIFHRDYPEQTFKTFFNELKNTFSPKYVDTANHCLYFSPESGVAATVHKQLPTIMEKYYTTAKKEIAEKKIKKLEAQLEEMRGINED